MSDANEVGEYEEYAYDEDFQKKILSLMVNDYQFLSSSATDVVRPDYFTDDRMKLICKWIFEYYAKYQDAPTMSALFNNLNKYAELHPAMTEETQIEMNSMIISMFEVGILDMEYVKNEIGEFAVSQEVKGAIMASIDLYKTKDPERIKTIPAIFEKAISVNLEADKSLSIKDLKGVPKRMKEDFDPAKLFKTGIPTLDDSLLGGLVPGVHLFVGRPGVGKSTVLTSLLASALYQGKNAFYGTFELQAFDILVKVASRVSGLGHNALMEPANEVAFDRAIDRIGTFKGDFRVNYWENKKASCNTIQAYLNRLKGMENFKPDIIILDYADLMLANAHGTKGNASMYEDLGDIFYDLNALANRFKCPVVTASQPQRSAWFLNTIELEHLADSARKAHVSFSVHSINQTREEEEENKMRLFGCKVRKGKTGKTTFMDFNKDIAFMREAETPWIINKDRE